ncbi:MAG: DUF2382 domain-containing protein [Acetobacteraceae bacterium]|nr:DUF2382 domain-containing protein [Acetobacteraceae bacterium]
MTMMTLTALYDSRAEADQAAERLVREAGVARADVTVHAQDTAVSGADATTSGAGESTGFFGSLKNMFMPEEDRHAYSEAISRGGFLLTARVEQGVAERATAILEEHGAVDLDDRQANWRTGGSTGQQAPMAAQTLADGTVVTAAAAAVLATKAPATPAVATAQAPAPVANAGEETIALVEERLTVGKRTVAGGRVRVRSYVVETPVQEQVSLRDETVSIERRAADRPLTGADDAAFRDRTIEAMETDQEAVVSKTARVTEELVVRKGVEERVETVRDTVRRTEVEVDDDRTAVRGPAKATAPGAVGAAKTATPAKPAPRR